MMRAFPDGAGSGHVSQSDLAMVERDLARGYISVDAATENDSIRADAVAAILTRVAKGDTA